MAEFSDVPEGFSVKQPFSDIPEGFDVDEGQATKTNPFLVHPVAKFAFGTALGLQQAGAGAEQLGGEIASGVRGLFTEDEPSQRPAELKSEIAMRDLRLKRLGGIAQAGGVLGEALPSTLLPGGPAGGLVRRVAGGVAADVASSVADPVREDETRLGNLKTAAQFSAALRGPGAGLSSAFRRISNARTGNFSNTDVKKLVNVADNEQISLFLDDATQAPLAQKLSVAAEYFGRIGTGAGRIRQNAEATAAANRWLQRVSGDTDDFAGTVQEGLKNKLSIFKREAGRKYARVAREIGDQAGEVPTSSFDAAANAGVASEAAKGTRANAAVTDFLNRFKDAPRGNFEQMIEFRSDFNKELGDFLKGDVSINKTSSDALANASNALTDDMAKFASANGAEGSWRAANKFYQDTVIKFKKGKLKSLLNEKSAANFDERAAWNYLVQNTTNPKRARQMFQVLDAKGRMGVRAGLIEEAVAKASSEGRPFSPARFAGYLESKSAVTDQFFRGQSGEEIKGLIKVMRAVERAGQFAENPPTGQRVIPLLLAGGAVVEPTTAIVAGTSALAIKGLFQSNAGRNLLLAASTATEGSKKFDRILQGLETVASRASN